MLRTLNSRPSFRPKHEQLHNDHINAARRRAYDNTRADAAARYQQQSQPPHPSNASGHPIANNNVFNISEAESAKAVAAEVGAILERQCARAIASHGGMSTTPWMPQVALG
jgi:hypothetical protein